MSLEKAIVWAETIWCSCWAWYYLRKPVVGIKASRYVWWVWSYLKEAMASASGLGGAGSQRDGRARWMVLRRLIEKDRFGACPHWASQVEGDHNKRNNGASQCFRLQREFPLIPAPPLRVFYASSVGEGNSFIYFEGFQILWLTISHGRSSLEGFLVIPEFSVSLRLWHSICALCF